MIIFVEPFQMHSVQGFVVVLNRVLL